MCSLANHIIICKQVFADSCSRQNSGFTFYFCCNFSLQRIDFWRVSWNCGFNKLLFSISFQHANPAGNGLSLLGVDSLFSVLWTQDFIQFF